MKGFKLSATVTVVLGVLSVLAIVCCHLALTDIWHGWEPNLDFEWMLVRVGFGVIFLFHVFAFIILAKVFGFLKKQASKDRT